MTRGGGGEPHVEEALLRLYSGQGSESQRFVMENTTPMLILPQGGMKMATVLMIVARMLGRCTTNTLFLAQLVALFQLFVVEAKWPGSPRQLTKG